MKNKMLLSDQKSVRSLWVSFQVVVRKKALTGFLTYIRLGVKHFIFLVNGLNPTVFSSLSSVIVQVSVFV